MSSDFRKSANNNKGGANPQPSSFQDKDRGLIEKYFKEGYPYYSKYDDLISRVMLGIFKKGDFSPVSINTEVDRTFREEADKLKSKYPKTFKNEDFSLDNVEDPSSGAIDTITQRSLRNLMNEVSKEDTVLAEAAKKLARVEYFSEHLKGLEEKVKTGEIKQGGIAEKEAQSSLSSAPYIAGALPHITPHRAPMPSAPHIPSHASAPTQAPPSTPSSGIASIHVPSPTPSPSQGAGNQGGGAPAGSGSSAPSSPKTTSTPPAPAHTTPSASGSSASQATQTTPKTPSTPSAPSTSPHSDGSTPTSTPTPPPASTPQTPPVPHTQGESAPEYQAPPIKTTSSRGAVGPQKQSNETQGEEPALQRPLTSRITPEPASQSSPSQTLDTSASKPSSTPPLPSMPAHSPQTSSPSQNLAEPSTDNAAGKGGEGFPKKTVEEIKKAVEEKLRDSLEKNVDNGMGGIAIQDEDGKGDAAKIAMIKAMAEKDGIDSQRNRINLINSAIKMDSARVDPANREAETQRIRKEAEEKMEKEMRKEIGGVQGRIAAKVLSKVMGLAAYKMAQELSERANRGKDQLAFVIVVTLFLAIIADLIDIARDGIAVGSAATVILAILGAILWIVLMLISSSLTAFVNIFWMQLAGGGHSKLMWKFLIRTVLGIGLNGIPIFGGIPFTVVIVLWNWYDFVKERKKAKKELKTFVAKNKSLLRNVSAN